MQTVKPITSLQSVQGLVADVKTQGKIVVDADEWTLSNAGFQKAPDTAIFVTNIAKWFTGGRGTGKFHAYSTNFGLIQSALAQALTQAGYTWTTGTNIKLDLPTLLSYDGIFLAGNAVDNQLLIEYVKAGGNVYLMAGTGVGGSQVEADRWNTFLNAFGLKLLGQYNGIGGNLPVNNAHPIFAQVKSLYQNNGNSIVDLAPEDSANQLVLTHTNGQGLIAVFEGKPQPTASLNLVTNSNIKLKSWKGDYLHRPDSAQGVTSWNTGIGNEWIVELIGDNKIKLKSWKGDYLHRPDSAQGVTSWNTGIGNEWILEVISNDPETTTTEAQPQLKPPTTVAAQPEPTTQTTTEAKPEPTATATTEVIISDIFYKGEIKRTQGDEYIEITNQGTSPADLSDWRVTSSGSNKQVFTFPKGTLLEPGKSFRVYSNQVHPEWGGFSFASPTAIWRDSGDEGKLYDAQGNNVSTWAYGTNSVG